MNEFLKGKKTYIVAGVAFGYLVVCQFTGKSPSTEIMGILGALGLATLRAGVSSPPATEPTVEEPPKDTPK